MADNTTLDGRYFGGIFENYSETDETPSILNKNFVVAENSIARGTSIRDHLTSEIDMYSLKNLDIGLNNKLNFKIFKDVI